MYAMYAVLLAFAFVHDILCLFHRVKSYLSFSECWWRLVGGFLMSSPLSIYLCSLFLSYFSYNFYFFHYSWFIVFCQFLLYSKVAQSLSLTQHTHTFFFSHYWTSILQHLQKINSNGLKT